MVATNAGGLHVLRHGSMRAQVVGIEAVLADGSVVRRLPGMTKDNTGYHLPSLLAGSEGTLGVITRARLRLVALLERRAVALLAVGSVGDAVSIAGALRRSLPSLQAAELFFDAGLELVLEHASATSPFRERHLAYLLIEVAASTDPSDQLTDAVAAVGSQVRDAVIAADEGGRARLWALRERHTEAINAVGTPHKLDVALPVARLSEFVERVTASIEMAAPTSKTFIYGHICEGNLHLGIVGPDPEDESVDEAVLRVTIELGGSISAEHGIGSAKVAWLEADRGAADVAAMRAIKRALDPNALLNPGVLLAPER